MRMSRKIIATLALGVAMTMPMQLIDSIPGQVVEQQVSPVVARIGRVVGIVEADNITVQISGSSVLVTASYLFPQYQPILGDLVYVTKQDAQWFVVGTMAGALNTIAINPSFELGTAGATPTDWTVATVNGGGGVATFTKFLDTQPLTGSFTGHLQLTPAGLGTSELTFRSALTPAAEGQQWSAGIFLRTIDLTGPNAVLVSVLVRWFNGAGVSISASSVTGVYNVTSTHPWQLIRPDAISPSVTAPIGTVWATIEVQTLMTIRSTASLIDMTFDYAILRRLT